MWWATTARTLLVLALVGAASAVAPAAPGARTGCAYAAGAHHVALVVQHSSGATVRVCVGFDGDSVTADQVLQMSGVSYQEASYGGGLGKAVCQIDGEPASYPPGCWTSTSPYWAMYVSRAGGGWAGSSLGVSSQVFRDGDGLGFHYVPQSAPAPPSVAAAGVCPLAPTATAAPAAPPLAVASGAPPVAGVGAVPTPVAEPVEVSPSPADSPSPSPSASEVGAGPVPPRLERAQGGPPLGWIAAVLAVVALAGLGFFQARRRA